MSTKELLDEINYLTSLIQSHKDSSFQPNSHHPNHRRNKREKYKWTGTGSTVAPAATVNTAPNHHSAGHSRQLQQLREKTKHGNLVYKPGLQSRPTQQSLAPSSTVIHRSSLATHSRTASQVPPITAVSSIAPRKRKRSQSKTGDHSTPNKKHKKALPSGSQLMWRRKTVEDPQPSPAPLLVESQPPLAGQTGHKAAPLKTLVVKRPLTPANSRYKWRRRLSSGSKKTRSRLSSSNLVVQSNYKLTRASLLRKSVRSPFHRRAPSTPRRLRKTTLSVQSVRKRHSRTPARPTKYKNKVWLASSAEPSDQDTATDSDAPSRLTGHESKTRRGNKQWVACSHRQSISRTAGTRARPSSAHGSRVVLLRDSKFAVDASGKKLRRVLSSSSELVQAHLLHSPSIKRTSFTRLLASQAVRRSKAYVWQAKQRSKQQDKSKQYCMFFNRFGKCKHMNTTCPYIHDPDKIAVCTKFLKGVCDKVDGTCPFSHKLAKEKMPVCSFFLRGVCSRDNCPYLHVSVGRDADVCWDFVKGYCPSGDQCLKQHILDCPEYLSSGSCSRGRACPLRHNKIARKRSRNLSTDRKVIQCVQDSGPLEEPKAFRRLRKWKEHVSSISAGRGEKHSDGGGASGELEFIPLEPKHTHDFIKL